MVVQLRAEAFNVDNHPNWGGGSGGGRVVTIRSLKAMLRVTTILQIVNVI